MDEWGGRNSPPLFVILHVVVREENVSVSMMIRSYDGGDLFCLY